MNFSDIIYMALRNLQQAKLRAALTITGVVVGVTSIVCMVSFALGLQENLLNQTLAKFDIFTTIPVSGASVSMLLEMGQNGNNAGQEEVQEKDKPEDKAVTGTREERRDAVFARLRKLQPRRMLDDKAVAEIEKIPGVEYVLTRIGFNAILQYEGHTRQMYLAGAPSDLSHLPGKRTLIAGTGFSNDYAKELLVSESSIRMLASPAGMRDLPPGLLPQKKIPTEAEKMESARKLIGKEVVLLTLREQAVDAQAGASALDSRYEKHSFKIVGVLSDEKGKGMFEQVFSGSSNLMVPSGTARLFRKLNSDPLSKIGETLLGDTGYTAAVVRVRTAADTQSVYEKINKMGLRAISLTQQLSQVKTVFMIIDASLALLAGISLFVAAIGISNTLIMSITERTREIGVMKAIGGDDRTIMSIFFCEAGLLGFIGGVLGVLGACLIDLVANTIVNHYIAGAGGSPVSFFFIPWYLWLGAIAFAIGVSLLAAAYPAYRAARVDPIKALRHD